MSAPKYIYAVYESPWERISIHRVVVSKETDRYLHVKHSGLAFHCASRLLKAEACFTAEDAIIKFIASRSADIESFKENIQSAKDSIDRARAGLSVVDVKL